MVGADTVTLLPTVVVTVNGDPPFILYVKVYGGNPTAPVKVTEGDGALRQTLTVPLTEAVGMALTITWCEAILVTVAQPAADVTFSVTVYVPGAEKLCDGFCKVDVLLTPLAGSPKFHDHPLTVEPAAKLASVKLTAFPIQVSGALLNTACGSAYTVVSCLTFVLVQPKLLVVVSVTVNGPAAA